EILCLDGKTVDARDASLSPDGHTIATWETDGRIRLFDAGTGQESRLLTRAPDLRKLTFSPDGKRLAVSHFGGPAIDLWDLDTGHKRISLPATDGLSGYPVFSPNGRQLASCSYYGGRGVTLWDTETGRTSFTLTGPKTVDSVAFS